MTIKLIGVSGSLRRESFNTRLLKAAQGVCPDGTQLVLHSIEGIPLYHGDVEDADGIPAAVAELKEAIVAADGLLIATPEYNNSVPGVLKNAIDWLSRPTDDVARVFGGLPVAIIGATPGVFGTVAAQVAWLPIMRALGTRLFAGGRLYVAQASKQFDGDELDESTAKRLAEFLDGFAAFIEPAKS